MTSIKYNNSIMFRIIIVAIFLSVHRSEERRLLLERSTKLVTCSGDGCEASKQVQSGTASDVVICYECRYCNEIGSTTSTVRCSSPRCCYVAIVREYKDQHSFAVRGCGEQNCSDTCKGVKLAHLQVFPEGSLQFCLDCDGSEGHGCNNNSYNEPHMATERFDVSSHKNSCFECENCKDVTMDTLKVYCATSCCYSRILRGKTQRGCAIEFFGPCGEYCDKNDYCRSCSGNNCNIWRVQNDSLEYHKVFKRTSIVRCYLCVGCYSVSEEMAVIDCPDKCCIILWWTQHGETTMIRKCVKLNGSRCEGYCHHMREVGRLYDPEGVVKYCEECTIDKCNYFEVNRPLALVKHDSSIKCYECEDCEEVSATTDVCESGCCYTIVDSEAMTIRGCANIQDGNSCESYCELLNTNVMNCTSCSTGNCNYNKFDNPTDDFNCYDCIDCISITSKSRLSKCNSKCCYTAIWTEFGNRHISRFCVDVADTPCDYFCSKMLDHDPASTIHYCEVCKTNACNSKYLTKTLLIKTDYIYCYECINCDEVSTNSKRVKCSSKNCFTAITSDTNSVRGCSNLEKPCSYKNYSSVRYCQVCGADYCNNNKLITKSNAEQKRSNIMKCYTCRNCDTISTNTALNNCNTNCCVTLTETVDGVTSTHRSCARLKRVTCQHYCSHIARSNLNHCKVCNIDKCNGMQNIKTPISCYKCRNCNAVTGYAAIEKCDSNCCYATALELNNGTIITKRGCVKASPCRQFCNQFRIKHAPARPTKIFYCKVCATDNCNKQNLQPPNKTPISCYNCIGCYNNLINAETIACPTGCCYTTVWTEYGRTTIARLCAFLYGRCPKFCNHLTHRVKANTKYGALHYCRSCCTANCNSDLTPAIAIHTQNPRDINCYDCNGCSRISNDTQSVLCASGCCYSQIKHLNNGVRTTVRQCGKIFPGTSCYEFCAYLAKQHQQSNPLGSVSYCNACTTNNCNNERLDTGVIGVVSKAIKCHDCYNCYTLSNDTFVDCPTGCCVAVVWTELGETRLVRDCVQPDETPCSDYCSNANRTMLHNDPKAALHTCKVCTSNNCNGLKVENPVTMANPITRCYECEDCNELELDKTMTANCPMACCYTAVTRSTSEAVRSERGCAPTGMGHSCVNICKKKLPQIHSLRHLTTEYCRQCTEEFCNSDNIESIVNNLIKKTQ